MKTIKLLILLLCSSVAYSQSFMTYNLRYDNPNDGINKWDLRKDHVSNLITNYSPDIFGTQEGLHHQLEYLNDNLKEYLYLGVGRDDGKTKGEFCAIFYKKDKYKIVEESTFWLSDTPNLISIGWDAVLERICTYALFEDIKSGNRFWVFNAHFDHVGKGAQYESSKLILKKIKEFNKNSYPVVFMGDLNLKPSSEAIQYLSKNLLDTHFLIKPVSDIGTFNAFKHNEVVTDRIDYIFVDKSTKVNRYQIIDDKEDGRFPSDHLPVYIELEK